MIKRYTIVEESEEETIYYKRRARDYIESFKENNSNKNNPYFIEILKIDYDRKMITIRKFKKLSKPHNLRTTDQILTEIEELPDNIKIAYRSNNNIKTLPVLTKESKKYTNPEYISTTLFAHAKDKELIKMIIRTIKDKNIQIGVLFYDLLAYLSKLDIELPSEINIMPLTDFYYSFCYKDNGLNYFNFRIISLILKEYEEKNREVEYEQLKIDGYDIGSRKDEFEEQKLGYRP